MKNSKFLLVGGGLAGSMAAFGLFKKGSSFDWVDEAHPAAATRVAYGLLNPVLIRGILPSWKATTLFPSCITFYQALQEASGIAFLRTLPVYHVLSGEDEAVRWRQAYESSALMPFISGDHFVEYAGFIRQTSVGGTFIHAAAKIDTAGMLQAFRTVMQHEPESISWNWKKLQKSGEGWEYEGRFYQGVIFAEGFWVKNNPYFSAVPFRPCRGDVLKVKVPGLKARHSIHKKVFLFPLENDHYICGSNYSWENMDLTPTAEGRAELENALEELLEVPYEITGHLVGIRPATADRRPVLGAHPYEKGLYIFNGLGSKGMMIAPFYAGVLADFLADGVAIPEDVDVSRFKKRLSTPT